MFAFLATHVLGHFPNLQHIPFKIITFDAGGSAERPKGFQTLCFTKSICIFCVCSSPYTSLLGHTQVLVHILPTPLKCLFGRRVFFASDVGRVATMRRESATEAILVCIARRLRESWQGQDSTEHAFAKETTKHKHSYIDCLQPWSAFTVVGSFALPMWAVLPPCDAKVPRKLFFCASRGGSEKVCKAEILQHK
jgi:hypothetical protein